MPASSEDLVASAVAAGITDRRIIGAMRRFPRAGFVPEEFAEHAYTDRPVQIPKGQTTTQPSLSARMIEALQVDPTDRVLEVGTGYGYQTALLCALAEHVTSIERWPELAERARVNLDRHGVTNVDVRVGDGTRGVPDAAPFDKVLVSAASRTVPRSVADQVAEGGLLVQPIGPGGNETVTLFRKEGERLVPVRVLVPARFVPLIGEPGPGTTDER